MPRELLAFVHIEKAAGTSFIHILRHNYFLRYLDVRPLCRGSNRLFTSCDLRRSFLINPFLRCIGGHSIKPFVDLSDSGCAIRYITILRDPVPRYISQFKYWRDRMGKQVSIEQFLATEEVRNYQVKKIAGSEDLEQAKQRLAQQFMLVGAVEHFNEFLLMLARRLDEDWFDPVYQPVNVARTSKESSEIITRYGDRLAEVNALDSELYGYFERELLPRYREEYGPGLARDLEGFEVRLAASRPRMFRRYLDYALRKAWFEPASGVLRMLNGMGYKGSY